ncbi:hypothetical protein L584_16340 [Pantoea agglomerans Tx10]|nr:hypothetical protein L584_16340 [Pantoea agglomerans Tx10]
MQRSASTGNISENLRLKLASLFYVRWRTTDNVAID